MQRSILLSFCLLLLYFDNIGQNTSQLIYLEQDKLTYVPFSMEGQSNAVNTIPDFSYAGYMGGGVALPTDIAIQAIITPEEGDDARRIQDAINLVESLEPDANGFRGVVLIKAGHYSLNNILVINESGVIIRGEGQGLNGTVLHSNPRLDHSVITILGSGGIFKDADSQQNITSLFVPVGSNSFQIEDATNFEVGDHIVVTRTPNQDWIDTLGMDQETLCQGKIDCFGWTPDAYIIDHERTITAITGNTITVDIPIVDVIEKTFGGGSITKIQSSSRISHCGVENIRIQSFYIANSDEDHAWTAVRLKDSEHCWVKEVTGQYLSYSTVNIEDSNFTTIQDCAYIDPKSIVTGGRRYSYAIQDGIGNLFQRCYAIDGRHDFITGSRVTGPNVFLDGLAASAESDIGPHHRWATGTLFDNIRGGSTRVWNRGSSGTGHGWAGAQTMFWNNNSYTGEFRVDSPLGAINWGIGCIGSNQTGEGYWESWDTLVEPRSLYLQQLKDRLGSEAVNNVTIPEQRSGDIYGLLASWGGQGNFSIGGISGEVPELSFTTPSDDIDVTTWSGGDIEVDALDKDGTISDVKLLINGEPIGIDYEAPYIFTDLTSTIQSLSHEVHLLQAIATDNDGNAQMTRLLIFGGDPPPPEEEEEPMAERLEIKIFPNPVQNDEFTIAMKEEGIYTVKILNVNGRIMDQIVFEGIDYHFACSSIASGIYIIEIQSNTDVLLTSKLLID